MQFDKWYFDFQNEEMFCYYYVSLLRIGGLRLTFTEAYQSGNGKVYHSPLRAGFGCEQSAQTLRTSHADIRFDRNHTNLSIRHKNNVINARWDYRSDPLSQIKQPLLKNEDGQCQWKVLAPRAAVNLHVQSNICESFKATGTGYIDFVRLTIPFWKLPFKTLHWGRLFARDDDWIILFHLQTSDNHLVYFANEEGWHQGIEPVVKKKGKQIQSFRWNIGPDCIEINPVCELHSDMILNPDRLQWLPSVLKTRLSRNGFERKYLAESEVFGKLFKGIIEEVRWDEN